MNIKVKRMNKEAKLPTRGSEKAGDGGFGSTGKQ